MSQLVTYHFAHALILQKFNHNHWEGNGNGCNANIFIVCLDFCSRWIPKVTNSFTLQRTPMMRSCGYLNLQV